MDGNTALGASSPAKPASSGQSHCRLTRAVVSSSSHMVSGFCKDRNAMETLSVSGTRPRWLERPPSRGTYGHLSLQPQPGAHPAGGSSQSRAGGASLLGALTGRPQRAFLHLRTQDTRTPGSLPSLQAPPSPPLPGVAWGSRSVNPDCWATVRVEGDAVERAWVLRQSTNGLFWTSMALQTHSRNALGCDGRKARGYCPFYCPLVLLKELPWGGLQQNLSSASARTKCCKELPPKGWE